MDDILDTKAPCCHTCDGGMTTISSSEDIVDRVPGYYEFYKQRQLRAVFAYILSKIQQNNYKVDNTIKQDIDNVLKSL